MWAVLKYQLLAFIGVVIFISIWAGSDVLWVIAFSGCIIYLLNLVVDRLSLERMRPWEKWLEEAALWMLYAPRGWLVAMILNSLVLSLLPQHLGIIVSTIYVVIATSCLLVSMKLDQLSKRRAFTI